MKKTLLLLFTLFASSQLFAQTSQGSFLIGGNVNFSNSKFQPEYDGQSTGYESKESSLSFTPQFGYFVADKLAIGTSINFSNETEENDFDGEAKLSSFIVSPFARLYLTEGLFGQGSIGFGTLNFEQDGHFKIESKSKIFNYNFGLGYNVFLTKSLAVEFLTQYSNNTYTSDQDSKSKTKESGLNFSVGLQFFLSK